MIAPWRFFTVEVGRLRQLSPSFLRATFVGDDLCHFADNGFDQRIKLVVPLPQHGIAYLPTDLDWHSQWRELPDDQRNPIRTYTVRAVRQHLSEVDVDLVLHHDGGPAARWAESAAVGDKLALLGPDARFDGPHGGTEFHLPSDVDTVLLAGDETAVPAISAILERLPSHLRGDVILEVPHPDDFLSLVAPPGVRILWRARNGATHGSLLIPAVQSIAAKLLSKRHGQEVHDIDIDNQILWEVPDEPAPAEGIYAWLAGEAAVIRTLRRHLVTEAGLDRRSVAFMGYWRIGRTEDNGG